MLSILFNARDSMTGPFRVKKYSLSHFIIIFNWSLSSLNSLNIHRCKEITKWNKLTMSFLNSYKLWNLKSATFVCHRSNDVRWFLMLLCFFFYICQFISTSNSSLHRQDIHRQHIFESPDPPFRWQLNSIIFR